MTDQEPTISPRRRPLLYLILATLCLAILWTTYFLLNLDLNNYRQEMEEQLSSQLSLPVRIGDVHYNFHETNLALHLAELEIGNSDSAIQFKAPSIMLDLQWRGLLQRDFKFTKISVSQSQTWIRPLVEVPSGAIGPRGDSSLGELESDLIEAMSIERLEIIDGAVRIETSHPGQAEQSIAMSKIDGELSGLQLGRVAKIFLQGELGLAGQSKMSPWQLKGESALKLSAGSGFEPSGELDLNINNLDLRALRYYLADSLPGGSIKGSGDLNLHLQAKTKDSIDFSAALTSEQVELSTSSTGTNPILFKKLLASGRLESQGERPGIDNFLVQVDESRLAGRIDWAAEWRPFPATITLMESKLAITELKQWLPDKSKIWQKFGIDLGRQGSINIEQADLTLFSETGSKQKWRLDNFKGELRQLNLSSKKTPALKIISLPFNFAGKFWKVYRGEIQWGSLPFTINGAGEYNGENVTFSSLDFTGEAFPEALLKEWHIPQHSLLTHGKVSFKGHLEGPFDQLSLDLQADLSQFHLNHPAGWTVSPEPDNKLALHATLTPQKVSLDHGAISWSAAKGRISGTYLLKNPEDFTVDAFVEVNDLARLSEILPVLEGQHLHGQASLSFSLKGPLENNPPEMTLTLRDVGLQPTRHIADLSQINGRVQLTNTGLAADSLRIHLGETPLVVRATIKDFTNPQLLLDVSASSIRADDLIFYSQKTVLRDVDGHLIIDGDGLSFAPVNVRLDGGTQASVSGTISFHEPFDVYLDVSSEFAVISEVIELWTGRSEASKKRSLSLKETNKVAHSLATVTINASVKSGNLYGMSFHNATGVIVPSEDRLTISPLDFSVGEGFCNAQVITDFSSNGTALLRISGHAQDVDALEVYRELLNQKNIVRGKLRGDFYLNGELGENYLPSSYGNFSIQVHKGVLHQFPVLSKVFSLLNVSQIFALQLPDMDVHGMPFDLLSANFHLEKGVLKSEDLKIQSEAMNQAYAGQFDLINKELDLSLVIHPLGTVDKIISRIPVAGWLLTGEDRALLTAYFAVKGKAGDAAVIPLPLGTITGPTFGLLKRTMGLPIKLFEDPHILWGGDGGDKQ